MVTLPVVAAVVAAVLAAAPAPAAAERGQEWVEENPMFVSALVVSMGQPPPGVVDAYFDDFGASAVSLWQDGAAEAAGWGGRPFVTWTAPDGTSVVWDGDAFVSTGQVVGGLPPDAPGRIGFQVGDEPGTVAGLAEIEAGMAAVRAADPDALVYSNFSYFAPQRERVLERWVASPAGDLQSSSDYFLGPLHYTVLERFRRSGLAKGVPYWQYLNAYVGSESDFERVHTASDLRWQALAGLTYGYTGHTWFLYQAADTGRHPTATQWGGSALHDGVGDWDAPRSPLWEVVAAINGELTRLGRTVRTLRSGDVRLSIAAGSSQPFDTRPWTAGAGGDPFLRSVGPAPGQPPMDVLAGFFTDPAGARYVMVQNARHTHARGAAAEPLPGADDPGLVRLEFDFAAAPPQLDRTRLEYMDPADGAIRSLPLVQLPPPPPPPPPPGEQPPAEPQPPPPSTRYAVEHQLPPGGVLLFKYANTIPFRLGRRTASFGVADPSQGRWHLRDGLRTRSFYYGNPGDTPFMGDWDCDGIDTPGLYRESDGFAYLRNSNSQGIADVEFFLGNPGDVAVPGDFDGDGCDTVSVYRPAEARFYVANRLGSGAAGFGPADFSYPYGERGDRPLAGDFDGDGIDTLALHRPSTGQVLIRNSLDAGAADEVFYFGDTSDRLFTGDWDGDGATTFGLFRDADATVRLLFANEARPPDLALPYGDPGFLPIAGVLH